MSLNPKLTSAAANAAADAVTALMNDGYLRLYSGSQPANADVAITTQTQLAELRFNATAFTSAVGGIATANALTADDSADNSGTCTWFRTFKSDGTTAVFDGSVGTQSANLILNSVSISAGVAVNISAFTYTQAKG